MKKFINFVQLFFLITLLGFHTSYSQGSNWVTQNSGITNTLSAVYFTDANNGIAVGGYNDGTAQAIILKTTDGGTSWVSQTTAVNSELFDVTFTDINTGTAVGNNSKIIRTTDGGITWINQPSGVTWGLEGVSFIDSNNGWIVGSGGTILHTTDGGNNWINQAVSTAYSLYDVRFIDTNIGIAVGLDEDMYTSIIIRTTNGGITWEPQLSGSGIDGVSLTEISFSDANTGTAVGWNEFNFTGIILRTTDGGINWITQLSGSNILFSGASFIDANNGTVVGADNTNFFAAILITTDGGTTWNSETPGTDNPLNAVSFVDANTGWAVGDMGTIIHRSGGETIPIAPTNLIAVADTHYVELSWDDNSDNETGFKIERKDDSLHISAPWVLIDSVVSNVISYVDTGLTGLTYSYRVYAYNESGNSSYSDSVEATTILPVELASFSATVNGNTVNLNWSTASETNNRGFEVERRQTSDVKGETINEWENVGFVEGNGTTTETKEYLFTDKNITSGSYSYRLKQIDYDGTYSYTKEVEVDVLQPERFSLSHNYPNPFNPSTVISWQLAVNSQITLKVYDVLGQEVVTLVNKNLDAGVHNIEFDAANFNSGVYFYTLEAKGIDGSNFVSTKKMTLIK